MFVTKHAYMGSFAWNKQDVVWMQDYTKCNLAVCVQDYLVFEIH